MARKRFIRGGRQVRETVWLGIVETVTALGSPNAAAIINTMSASINALRPFTIVRVHGFLGIRSDQIVADESYDVALGMAVVSDQALAVGITAVPTPFTELDSDLWFVHQMLMGRQEIATAVGIVPLRPWIQYQSKAMRKVNENSGIAFVAEGSSVSSGTVVHHAARMLIKLH